MENLNLFFHVSYQILCLACYWPTVHRLNEKILIFSELGPYIFDASRKTVPMGRLGDVFDPNDSEKLSNDLIPQIIFNLSPGATYTTGENFNFRLFFSLKSKILAVKKPVWEEFQTPPLIK